jgi:CheY-like chemotaxis protein
MLSQYLQGMGFEVLEAADGQQAIDIARTHKIRLVLMDICMPGVDGYAAATAIKENTGDEYLPVIFVTALDDSKSLTLAIEAGGDDYVSKPIKFDVLTAKINAHLRIRELHDQLKLKNKELEKYTYQLEREQELVSHFFENAKAHSYVNEALIKQHISSMSLYNGDVFLAAQRPGGGVTVLLGDFTGHGLAAAVGSIPVSQIFFDMVTAGVCIGDIAREVNRQIKALLPVEMFFSAVFFEFSASGERLMIWHGGLPDVFILRKATNQIETVSSTNMPLGILDDSRFNTEASLHQLQNGDRIYGFTDGLTEGVNAENSMFGEEGIIQAIESNPDNAFETIVEKYYQHCGVVNQDDDISLIEITSIPTQVKELTDKPVSSDMSKLMSWQMKVDADAEVLGKVDVISGVIEMLGQAPHLMPHKGVLYTLLSEMYNNALEHGILNMPGQMKDGIEDFDLYYQKREERLHNLGDALLTLNLSFDVSQDGGVLRIRMHHNGVGFNPEEMKFSDDALNGRGMALIEALSTTVEYSDNGRCLEVTFNA